MYLFDLKIDSGSKCNVISLDTIRTLHTREKIRIKSHGIVTLVSFSGDKKAPSVPVRHFYKLQDSKRHSSFKSSNSRRKHSLALQMQYVFDWSSCIEKYTKLISNTTTYLLFFMKNTAISLSSFQDRSSDLQNEASTGCTTHYKFTKKNAYSETGKSQARARENWEKRQKQESNASDRMGVVDGSSQK